MDNEFMNEEVVEVTEEIVKKAKTGKGLIGFGVGVATTLGCGVAYKYVVKPLAKKWSARKAAKNEAQEPTTEENVETKIGLVE